MIARKEPDSPGYSDIFRQNSANCGMLLVEVDSSQHQKLVDAGSGASVTIDLPAQTIDLNGEILRFEMNEATKLSLVEGLDLVGTTLRYEKEISDYEKNHLAFVPR